MSDRITRLRISRRENESFMVGDAKITVLSGNKSSQTALLVEAPESVRVVRSELLPTNQQGESK